jgi:hypothetical protein
MEIKTINPIILDGKCVANKNLQSNNDSEKGISEFSNFDFGNPFTQSTPLNNLSKPKPSNKPKYPGKPMNPFGGINYGKPSKPITMTNQYGQVYSTPKSITIPNNEDLQPVEVTDPKKANWWSKQTKNQKILFASVGLITVASIIYFMTKKKK